MDPTPVTEPDDTRRFDRRDTLVFPLLMWVTGRVIFIAGVYLPASIAPAGVRGALEAWDGAWYQRILTSGYPADPGDGQSTIAFFPGFPLLARPLTWLGLGPGSSLLIVATVAGAAACVLLMRLAISTVGLSTAKVGVALFALSPGSAVLTMAYSESVFLCGVIGAFLLARDDRWLAAGLVGAVATATRPIGYALVLGLLVLAVQRWRAGRGITPFLAPIVATTGAVAYAAFLWNRTGDPLVYTEVQRQGWGTRLDPTFPFDSLIDSWDSLRTGDLNVLVQGAGVFLFVGALVVLALRPPPPEQLVFALVVLVSTVLTVPLGLRPRFLMTAFPVLFSLAGLLRKPEQVWVALMVSAGALGIFSVGIASGIRLVP